jgi:hypothetical protein
VKRRRFVVRRIDAYRKGQRRWVVWDRVLGRWADDAQTTRRQAQDICDELEAQAAAVPTPARPPDAPTAQPEPRTPVGPGPDGLGTAPPAPCPRSPEERTPSP